MVFNIQKKGRETYVEYDLAFHDRDESGEIIFQE